MTVSTAGCMDFVCFTPVAFLHSDI